MKTEIEVTLVTCPHDAAEMIASDLVNKGLAACVNIVPSIISIYRWKDSVEKSKESLLVVKSSVRRRAQLEARVLELHPYSCPEIITIPVQTGFSGYLDWVMEQTAEKTVEDGRTKK